MNTCKAALRILKARKLYVIIYLVLIGTMMFSISWQIMRGSTAARATTYEPESARIAVIDRDDDAEQIQLERKPASSCCSFGRGATERRMPSADRFAWANDTAFTAKLMANIAAMPSNA